MEAHAEPDEPTERDNTDEWRLAPARPLATVAELEGRIDVALATAHAAEEAALEIGAASLEAAEQARRAAALAERASASAAESAVSAREASVRPIQTAPSALAADAPSGADPAVPSPSTSPSALRSDRPLRAPVTNGVAPRRPDPFEDRITAFRLRAEKVMIRLQKIEAGQPPHEPTEVVRLSGS
jgi:hypothetical protein